MRKSRYSLLSLLNEGSTQVGLSDKYKVNNQSAFVMLDTTLFETFINSLKEASESGSTGYGQLFENIVLSFARESGEPMLDSAEGLNSQENFPFADIYVPSGNAGVPVVYSIKFSRTFNLDELANVKYTQIPQALYMIYTAKKVNKVQLGLIKGCYNSEVTAQAGYQGLGMDFNIIQPDSAAPVFFIEPDTTIKNVFLYGFESTNNAAPTLANSLGLTYNGVRGRYEGTYNSSTQKTQGIISSSRISTSEVFKKSLCFDSFVELPTTNFILSITGTMDINDWDNYLEPGPELEKLATPGYDYVRSMLTDLLSTARESQVTPAEGNLIVEPGRYSGSALETLPQTGEGKGSAGRVIGLSKKYIKENLFVSNTAVSIKSSDAYYGWFRKTTSGKIQSLSRKTSHVDGEPTVYILFDETKLSRNGIEQVSGTWPDGKSDLKAQAQFKNSCLQHYVNKLNEIIKQRFPVAKLKQRFKSTLSLADQTKAEQLWNAYQDAVTSWRSALLMDNKAAKTYKVEIEKLRKQLRIYVTETTYEDYMMSESRLKYLIEQSEDLDPGLDIDADIVDNRVIDDVYVEDDFDRNMIFVDELANEIFEINATIFSIDDSNLLPAMNVISKALNLDLNFVSPLKSNEKEKDFNLGQDPDSPSSFVNNMNVPPNLRVSDFTKEPITKNANVSPGAASNFDDLEMEMELQQEGRKRLRYSLLDLLEEQMMAPMPALGGGSAPLDSRVIDDPFDLDLETQSLLGLTRADEVDIDEDSVDSDFDGLPNELDTDDDTPQINTMIAERFMQDLLRKEKRVKSERSNFEVGESHATKLKKKYYGRY